jgi:acetyltransferase-like isoleucine patch superfamily enzyme
MNQVGGSDSVKFYPGSSVTNFKSDKNSIVIGQNVHIRGELLVFKHGGKILIGDNVYVGDQTRIWSGEEVVIGNNVLISHNVNISDTSAHELDSIERAAGFRSIITSGHPSDKGSVTTAPVIIEDYAWINPYCMILKGVRIGEGAVVGAGSIVVKDVPAYTLVAGNPAKIIRAIKV